MVKASDYTCCDCESAAEKKQIKERALSSINKVYTFDNRTFWPDGTGMVTVPLPTQDQLNLLDDMAGTIKQVDTNTADIGTLKEQVNGNTADIATAQTQIAKNSAGIATNAELIAGEQTQIDSIKTSLETSYQAIAQKGSANGYAGLDNNARVPLAQLYAGTSANQMPLIGKQLLANEMLIVDADGLTIRSRPIVQTLSFRGIYATKEALPSEGNVSGDYAIVSDGTAQDDTGYYVWGFNSATDTYEWVWTILFDANSYQLVSNLVTSLDDSSDDSHYPSAKAVKDYHDASIGTVEQEITDINNDLATVQTTLNEHTTGISNAISQAQTAQNTAETAQTSAETAQTSADIAQNAVNNCYNAIEQNDNQLTFTKVDGSNTKVDLSSLGMSLIEIPISLITATPKTRETATNIYQIKSNLRQIIIYNSFKPGIQNNINMFAYSSIDYSSTSITQYWVSQSNITEINNLIFNKIYATLPIQTYKDAGYIRLKINYALLGIPTTSGNYYVSNQTPNSLLTINYNLETDTFNSTPSSAVIVNTEQKIPAAMYAYCYTIGLE